MSLLKKTVCCLCAITLAITVTLPCLMTVWADDSDKKIILSDGSEWLVQYDESHNVMSTDGDGRYYVKTDAPNDSKSGFSIMSKTVYPITAEYQLQCREALEATTSFGLSSEYSLKTESTNSVRIFRQNGYGNENIVRLYVKLSDTDINIKITDAQFTRNRVSTIGVKKKNGSWYMTWNNIILDGEDCSEEVKSYLKLENHFPAEALDNAFSLHFFASCDKLLTSEDSFMFKADCKISGGVMSVYSDSYSDPNDPASIKKSAVPKSDFNADIGKYSLSMESETTSATIMSPVALIDSETGESEIFNVETYIEKVITGSQYWIEYGFSTDPLFSDGSEKSFCAVKIENNGGVHIGHFAPGWTTFCGTNNNFFNDPENSGRLWQFKKDGNGNIYLNIWGANLAAANAPITVGIDFGSYVDKPIYMRITARGIGNSVLKSDITPYTGEKTASLISETDEKARINPTNLKEAQTIVNEYDGSPYKYAISDIGLATILKTRIYMYSELEKALKEKIHKIENNVRDLPLPEELENQYSSEVKSKICEAYLEYTSLGNDINKVDVDMAEKIKALLNKLTEIDSEFAAKKVEAENFGDNVKRVKALGNITVDNYSERNEAVLRLRTSYNEMDAFLKSIVDKSSLDILEELENELNDIKEPYYAAELIKALPAASEVDLADQNAIVAARKKYDALNNKDNIPQQLLKKLEDCEKQLEDIKIRELDWYSAFSEVSYSGNNSDSYTFENTADKVSGYVFATTTKKFNMIRNELYWIGMGCGGGQFMMLGLSDSVRGQQISKDSINNICFILRPAAGDKLMVTFFDENGEAEQIKTLSGFNLATVHKFAFEKADDSHWYLTIDGDRCNDRYYDRLDNYMETYGKDTNVSIGGCNGFKAANVMIADKNSTPYTGDWDFSTIGCSYSGDSENVSLSLKIGAQAIYKPIIKEPDKLSIKVDSGLQHKLGSDTVIGFLKKPIANGNYSCEPSNGVVVRFINRPAANDSRTHILMLLNGQWVTIDGKEPSIIDAEYYTVSIERNADEHYYMRIKWENGTKLIKFERGSKYYSLVQLDDLVEDGAYFTFSSINNTVNAGISMVYNSINDEEEKEESKEIISYILEFEKNFDNLNARNKSAYEKMHAEWLKLSFLSKNSIMADFMDDEAAYNLLLDVADYKDGNLDEYYTETEEKLVNKNELEAVIAECKADKNADYVISFAADGSVIENIKNLSAVHNFPIFSVGLTNRSLCKALCILSAATISYGAIFAFGKRKIKKR